MLLITQSNQPIPLLPPPPAPLNIPSRARQRLEIQLAKHKKAQEEQENAASEFGLESDDPFAALGDADDQDGDDPFSLDEEEQDITSFGRRSNSNGNGNEAEDQPGFSVHRGISNLFNSGQVHSSQNNHRDDFEGSLEDSSSEGSGSDADPEYPPLEARRSLERRPLDIDDDEEMGEMVAPTEEANSSDEEILSPFEKERLGISISNEEDDSSSEFDGQEDKDDDGDALVEIAMPAKRQSRGSRGSIG